MRPGALGAIAAGLSLAAGACSAAAQPAATTTGDPQNGAALAEKHCASCHAINADAAVGGEGAVAPDFTAIDLADPEALRAAWLSPHPQLPELAAFSDAEVQDLFIYIGTLAE